MEFFNLIRATQKSGKPDGVIWRTAKSEARANLQLEVDLEDAGIETGRGHDYNKPIRTDFPVFNDLPAEGVLDFEWCTRYELADDQRTWQLKAGAVPADAFHQEEEIPDSGAVIVDGVDTSTGEVLDGQSGTGNADITEDDDQNTLYPVVKLRRPQLIISQFISNAVAHHVSQRQRIQIGALEMDTDNNYIQNLLLATRSIPEIDELTTANLWKLTDAVKKVFPEDKRTELGLLLNFLKVWIETPHIDRGILVKEWAGGNRISGVQKQETQTTTETPRYKRAVTQSMANLGIEIAIAQLYPDAEPGKISRPQLIGAKDLADRKEDIHVKALKILGKTTDILDYDAHSIFGVTRAIKWNSEEDTSELRAMVRNWFTENGIYENGEPSKGYPEWNDAPRGSAHSKAEIQTFDDVDKQPTTEHGEFAEVVSDPTDPNVVAAELAKTEQPQVANLGAGMFSIEGLMASPAPTSTKQEATSNVQMEAAQPVKDEIDIAVSTGESADAAAAQTDAVTQNELSSTAEAEKVEWPDFFEPGRYEGIPNEVYHAANGISSTMVKDARYSLMYFEARHVAKTIQKVRSPVLDMGNLVHALALQPDDMDKEFSVEPEIPEGAFTTTATIRAYIDEYNATLPALLSSDDIKALLEAHNATLPAPFPLGASVDESYASYEQLPEEFQRIENGTKHTAAAMKACIKEYNATLPAPVKTNGSRDALLEQLAIINPDLVAQEAQKPQPLKVSGTKTDLIQVVKSVNPDAVFADELLDAWRENPEGKVLVTRQQLSTALAIQKALLNHPTAGKLLTHPSRAVEVSYFGIDEETGLEIRVRPDLEIDMGGLRIGADLKTISMWNIKQEGLRAKLHREIIERDYHLSAAMYCETAALDQFFWIFVNKDENYHWIAIIEASEELLELGMLEYRKAMRAIAHGFDTGEWPAPIIEDYAEELNDFDVRRLEALRAQA
ncbi:RecE family exodeoxyribonuclease [Raoultella terrigena]|uniref:RecE family exodeoxyribonuclease n=1 Tax=Raoultella terrigena TaxID=577 RepID=UPI001F268106|nr:PD-(D/E)XK nuclease-like domain-containing protein [Raoultella terrigena]